MSGRVLQFPISDDYALYAVGAVRDIARAQGWDVKQTERDFLASGCSQARRNELAERARRARMHTPDNDGPEAA